MGLLSSIFGGGGSSTTSTANQTTTNTDNSVGGSSGIIATGGSTINYLDKDVAMAALDKATELGKAAFGQSDNFLQGALKFADNSAAVTEASRIANNNLAQTLAETAISRVQQSAQSDPVQVVNTIAKYGAWALGGIAAIVALVVLSKSKPARP